MRRLRFVIAAMIVLLLAGLFVLFEVGFYRTTDGARMAMRRINQRIHYGLGYQLPGTPDLARFDDRLSEKGFKRGDAIFIRIFKSELTLELWMRKGDRFELFASYPICYWSGRLGPKIRTGDRQAPPRASIRSRRGSSTRTAAGSAPSISASRISTTRRTAAPAPI